MTFQLKKRLQFTLKRKTLPYQLFKHNFGKVSSFHALHNHITGHQNSNKDAVPDWPIFLPEKQLVF